MKAWPFLVIFFLVIITQVSAAQNPSSEGTGTARITNLYGDLESFDVTLNSNQPETNLVLEVTLLRPVGISEKQISRRVFSIEDLPANKNLMKIGFWNLSSPERGAYMLRARLLKGDTLLSEAKYPFVYGSNSSTRLQVNDLVPNSQGISVALSPKGPSLFNIEYMLVDGSDVVYLTKSESLSLTSTPEVFSANWGTVLENNKEYTGRVKIQVYSPDKEFIAAAENFTAADNAKITDIYQDETGASATVLGLSQVPFEGKLGFSVYGPQDPSGKKGSLVESSQVKVPVLLNNDDETVEVAWKERLTEGVYLLEIDLLGNNGELIERRETIIESSLSPEANTTLGNNSSNLTEDKTNENNIPGFSSVLGLTGVIGIILISKVLGKSRKKQKRNLK